MLPAQNFSEPSAVRSSATSSGKSLYSMTCTLIVERDEVADLVLRRLLGDRHRSQLRFGEQVIADELRIADRRERIVDLQIEQVLDAAAAHVVDRAALRESGDRAAVAIGAEEQRVLLGEQQLAGRRVDRRHRALAKEHEIVGRQTEPLVLVQELDSARRA